MAVDLCHDTVVDWSMSGKQDHLTAIVLAAAVTRMKLSKQCRIKPELKEMMLNQTTARCLRNGYSPT